jgi:hypothetical protein
MLFAGDDGVVSGDELCAIPDTASTARIGSIETLFIGFSPSLWSCSRPIHVSCLTIHPGIGYWQKRQFTTKHFDEKTLDVTSAKRRLPQHHFRDKRDRNAMALRGAQTPGLRFDSGAVVALRGLDQEKSI